MFNSKKNLLNHFKNLNFNKILGYDIAVFKGLKNKSKNYLFDNISQLYILFKNLLGTIYRSIFTYPEIKYSKNKNILYKKSINFLCDTSF